MHVHSALPTCQALRLKRLRCQLPGGPVPLNTYMR